MRLGTRIQLYITVMTVILIICVNIFVYVIFKHFSIASELNQLEARSINIIEEIKKSDNRTNQEIMNNSYILSDGYISVIDKNDKAKVNFTTNLDYNNIQQPFQSKQYKKTVAYKSHHFAMISLPIVWEHGEVVNLQLYENVDFKYESFQILKWILIGSVILLLIVIFYLNRVITNIITQPILKLSKHIKETQETKDYLPVEVQQNDSYELQELSTSFNDMMNKLKEHDERQQAFIMNASHELKTPITVINSYSQMLQRFGKKDQKTLDESIHAIGDEAKKMKYLTEQLLYYAQITKNKTESSLEYENIVELIEEITHRLKHVYKQDIKVEVACESYEAWLNISLFKQLIHIFLDNAHKYGESLIIVRISDNKDSFNIEIMDDGIGIPESDLPHIFTRFYRVDKARSRSTGGSGLGLSIAQEIATQQNIVIDVKSEVNKGSSFILTVPKGVIK
ncbi:sensor histidine kinase [Staphylococcus equorum]|uniref:sensor histidine kinase n=1 Tax=Staphylococcus equorum TaxID=246432 RepID=UPI0021BF0620|nr:HAMP domain-containing sensor histidine kinase [Staphylococcus equorum]